VYRLVCLFNKVEDEEPESEVKTENGNVLAAILTKNRKNCPQLNFGLLYLENSPTYDTDMYVVFDKVDNDQFESEEKTGIGSSFVCQFDEKPSKTAENRRKLARVSRI